MKFHILIYTFFLFQFHLSCQDSIQHILAGKMINVVEAKVEENVFITIRDDKIIDIQYNPDLKKFDSYIDLSDFTVLPGLIDCHTHLTGNWYMDKDEFDEYSLPPASYGILGTLNAKKTIEAGFTTVRDVHSNFYGDIAIRNAINMGWIPGPRMFVSGPGLSITGGHGAWGNWLAPHLEFEGNLISIADGENEVRKEVRKHLKHTVDWIKVFATGGFYSYGTSPGAASYSIEELSVAVVEAGKQNRYVAAHAHGADGIVNALEAGVRSIEHGTYLDKKCIELFIEKDAFLVMDLMGAYYDLIESKMNLVSSTGPSESDHKEYLEIAKRFKMAYDADVKIAFGTDAGVFPHGRNAEQFHLMKKAGMDEMDILKSATITAAELLDKTNSLGSIEVGKFADIIAVKGNPLSNITKMEETFFVMKNGKVYKTPK